MTPMWVFFVSFILSDGSRQWMFSENHTTETRCNMARAIAAVQYDKMPYEVLIGNCVAMRPFDRPGAEVEDIGW